MYFWECSKNVDVLIEWLLFVDKIVRVFFWCGTGIVCGMLFVESRSRRRPVWMCSSERLLGERPPPLIPSSLLANDVGGLFRCVLKGNYRWQVSPFNTRNTSNYDTSALMHFNSKYIRSLKRTDTSRLKSQQITNDLSTTFDCYT